MDWWTQRSQAVVDETRRKAKKRKNAMLFGECGKQGEGRDVYIAMAWTTQKTNISDQKGLNGL